MRRDYPQNCEQTTKINLNELSKNTTKKHKNVLMTHKIGLFGKYIFV